MEGHWGGQLSQDSTTNQKQKVRFHPRSASQKPVPLTTIPDARKEVQGGLPLSQSEAPPSPQPISVCSEEGAEEPGRASDCVGFPSPGQARAHGAAWENRGLGKPVANTLTRARPRMEPGSHHLGVPGEALGSHPTTPSFLTIPSSTSWPSSGDNIPLFASLLGHYPPQYCTHATAISC